MRSALVFITGITLFNSWSLYAANTIYCPENHGYINVGMTADQVLSSCGQPTSIEKSNQGMVQKIPVTQLIYTNLDQGAVYSGLNSTYQMWSLPSGTTQLSLEVSIMDNKVSGIQVNGGSSNAMTLCGGNPIQIGDPADNVFSACGDPSSTNQTYITRNIQTKVKPEIWTYQSQSQSSFSLTFVNGVLQSIN
jgi:hypothetical protein